MKRGSAGVVIFLSRLETLSHLKIFPGTRPDLVRWHPRCNLTSPAPYKLRWQTTPRPPRNTHRLSIFCEIKLQSSHFTNVQSIMASQDRAWTPQEALYPADELEEVLGQKRCAELKQECTEEILLLHLFNEFEWETSPRKKRIDIVDLSPTDVKHLTRFTISEIKRIRRLLGIPDRFSTPARVPFHGDEALFLLLCRLAHPIKVRSLELFFGYRESTVSEATHWVLYHIYKNCDFFGMGFRRCTPPVECAGFHSKPKAFPVRSGYAISCSNDFNKYLDLFIRKQHVTIF
jgi:hypothetical protein